MFLIFKDLSMMELVYYTCKLSTSTDPTWEFIYTPKLASNIVFGDILFPAAPVFCFFDQKLAAI